MKFIDPVTLLKLSNLEIRARYVVEGFITGIHSSPYYGHSLEFAQHRQYSMGDELKYIDWKVYARTDKFFVKQYQEETNLRAYIVLDISKSMKFPAEEKIDKFTYGLHLAAVLSYLLLKQDDSVGLIVFDNKIVKFIPPRVQSGHFSNIINILENLTAGEDTQISKIIYEFTKFLKRRGLIIFISDLFDKPQEVLRSIKSLKFTHHDVIVFHILSTYERDFPYTGTVNFESSENPSFKIKTDTENIVREYKSIFQTFIQEYKIGFRNSGIDYCLLYTDTPLEVGLSSFLSKRK